MAFSNKSAKATLNIPSLYKIVEEGLKTPFTSYRPISNGERARGSIPVGTEFVSELFELESEVLTSLGLELSTLVRFRSFQRIFGLFEVVSLILLFPFASIFYVIRLLGSNDSLNLIR